MSVLAIVSKAIFEKEARGSALGDVWSTGRYASNNPGLASLANGGSLYLVTVRPGDVLWLVAVLENPRFDGLGWKCAANTTPIADVTKLLPKLRFSTGKGIAAAPGKLGMSLQTPRVLTADDEKLFGAPKPAPAEKKKPESIARPTSAASAAPLTLAAWRQAGKNEREAAAHAVVAKHPQLSLLRTAGEDEVPVFVHAPSRALFHLVLGGTWRHGFSPAEYDAVYAQYRGWWEADTDDAICEDKNQLPAPYEVTLPPFLLASRPFDPEQLQLLERDDPAPSAVSEGRKTYDYEKVAKLPADKYLKYLSEVGAGSLSERDVDRIEERLRLRGLRLPTNDEWEAAARAGGDTAFPAGNTIPKTPSTGENRFGFMNMGAWPEVVAGECPYVKTPPTRSLRGGAAMCYPGQDCGEWTLMLSAIRLGASMFAGMLHVRPMMEIA